MYFFCSLFPEKEMKEEYNSVSSEGERYGKEASYSPKETCWVVPSDISYLLGVFVDY